MKKFLHKIVHDPEVLGLKTYYASTRFGRLHYVAPPIKKHDEVMLFIHGFGANWSVWTPLLQSASNQNLIKNSDFLLVDLPSFGKSENTLKHLNSQGIAEELIRLCKKLGYKKIRITGHSMGGFLTLDAASRYPEILSVHVIAGTYFRLLNVANHPFKGLFKTPRLAVYYFIQLQISKSKLLTSLTNTTYKFLLGRNRKPVYELGGNSFLYASRNGIGYNAATQWSAISCPVNAVYGAADKLVSQNDMRELKRIIPKAKTASIEGAGHSLLITHVDQVAKALY